MTALNVSLSGNCQWLKSHRKAVTSGNVSLHCLASIHRYCIDEWCQCACHRGSVGRARHVPAVNSVSDRRPSGKLRAGVAVVPSQELIDDARRRPGHLPGVGLRGFPAARFRHANGVRVSPLLGHGFAAYGGCLVDAQRRARTQERRHTGESTRVDARWTSNGRPSWSTVGANTQRRDLIEVKERAMPAQMARTGAHRDPIESCSSETLDRVRDHLQSIADTRGVATVTTRGLGDALRLGPTTVRRALRLLEDAGETELLRRGTGGRYGTRYRVHAVVPAPSAA